MFTFCLMHSVRVGADTGMLSPPSRIWINHVPLFNFRGSGTFMVFLLAIRNLIFIMAQCTIVESGLEPLAIRARD